MTPLFARVASEIRLRYLGRAMDGGLGTTPVGAGTGDLIRRALTEAASLADILEQAARGDLSADEWLVILATIGRREARLSRALNRVSAALDLPTGAHDRILRYLQLRVGQVVEKEELDGVSGISEWARRVRELRVDDGWPISTNGNRDDLRPGQYVLESQHRNEALAARWETANRIRRMDGSAKDRIAAFILDSVGQTLSKDEVAYVAKVPDYPRWVRELIEDGYQISSSLDNTDLRPGEYRLTTTDRLPAWSREAIRTRFAIVERDGSRCVSCGEGPGGGRVLQVHHRIPVEQGGTNEVSNLETVCQFCHAGKHAVSAEMVDDELVHPESEVRLG